MTVDVLFTGSQFVVMYPVLSVETDVPVMQYGEPSTMTSLVGCPTTLVHAGATAAAVGVAVTVTVGAGDGALVQPASSKIATAGSKTNLCMR